MKITEYPVVAAPESGDVILLDGTSGTRTMLYSNLVKNADGGSETAGISQKRFTEKTDGLDRFTYIDNYIAEKADPTIAVALKRSTYRGKNLGTAVTTAQYTAINSGLFNDIFLGDYWVIGNITYRVADFDYWYRTGDTECTKHHLVIVPDTTLYNHVMNDTNITTGAYVGSKMYTEGLNNAKTTIKAAFPSHVLNHREFLQNATNANTPGYPTGAAWMDSEIELMNENMVYGTNIMGARGTGVLFVGNWTIEHHQLALFKENPRFINTRQSYWLRDVVSSTAFAAVSGLGHANGHAASYTYAGVRPVFGIAS